jgi:hypothetical protein
VLAPQILTISDLEKAINKWQLDNSTDKALVNSMTTLMDLLTRSMQHRNRDEVIHYPELFRVAITRVQRDNTLPASIYKALNEARLRIRDSDRMPELNTILFGALNPYIGFKPRGNGKPQGLPKSHQVQSQVAEATQPHAKKQEKAGNKGQQQQKPQQPQQQQQASKQNQSAPVATTSQGARPKEQKDTKNRGKKQWSKGGNKGTEKKFFFVEPWPENKHYVSKNGNSLTKECEEHFKGFCFKCGHNSHSHEDCKIYKSKDAFITLCTRCYQGFHDTCRSRRWGLQEEYMSKKLAEVTKMCQYLAINQQSTSAQVHKGPAIRLVDGSSSDED